MLLLPRAYSLPHNLTKVEESSPTRIRAGAALTLTVNCKWKGFIKDNEPCVKCTTLAPDIDVYHLLWTFPGTQYTREHLLRWPGLLN